MNTAVVHYVIDGVVKCDEWLSSTRIHATVKNSGVGVVTAGRTRVIYRNTQRIVITDEVVAP